MEANAANCECERQQEAENFVKPSDINIKINPSTGANDNCWIPETSRSNCWCYGSMCECVRLALVCMVKPQKYSFSLFFLPVQNPNRTRKKKSQMISIFSLLAYAENSSKKKSNAKAFPTKSLSSLSICWYLWDFTRNFSLFRNQLSIWWPTVESVLG